MGKAEKGTKSEIWLLCCTVLFLVSAVILHLSSAGESFADFTVQTQYGQTGGESIALVDVNTADEALLEQLPGVGQTLARRIVEYRRVHGSFSSVDELLQVNGIGEQTLEKMRDYITVTP